jgi:hypothetical protein
VCSLATTLIVSKQILFSSGKLNSRNVHDFVSLLWSSVLCFFSECWHENFDAVSILLCPWSQQIRQRFKNWAHDIWSWIFSFNRSGQFVTNNLYCSLHMLLVIYFYVFLVFQILCLWSLLLFSELEIPVEETPKYTIKNVSWPLKIGHMFEFLSS